MKRIYTASNLPDAFMLQDLLLDLGIQSEVFNQYSSGAAGELAPTDIWPEIWIRNEQHSELALDVVNRFEIQRQTDNMNVIQCGECGEENPGNFDYCWNCSRSLARAMC